jgi:hypothetical protein
VIPKEIILRLICPVYSPSDITSLFSNQLLMVGIRLEWMTRISFLNYEGIIDEN